MMTLRGDWAEAERAKRKNNPAKSARRDGDRVMRGIVQQWPLGESTQGRRVASRREDIARMRRPDKKRRGRRERKENCERVLCRS